MRYVKILYGQYKAIAPKKQGARTRRSAFFDNLPQMWYNSTIKIQNDAKAGYTDPAGG